MSTVVFMMATTVIAKALGMLRGMLTASRYGTGMTAQAFSEASHISLTLFDLAFGAALLGCFIPIYNTLNREDGHADEFARVFLNLILLVTTALAGVGMTPADGIIALLAPGFDAVTRKMAVRLLRVMFPMIVFTGSAYTLVGVMQSKGRYMLPAAVSAVSNAGVIVYLLFFDAVLGENSIYGLAAAYVFSWFIQFITLAIPLRASGFRFLSVRRDTSPEVVSALKKAVKMAPPIMIGSWLAPVGVLSGLYFASFIDVSGAVTVFDYTYAVYVIIAGTLTYSICNYAFPFLSRLGNGEDEEWSRVVRSGLLSSAAIILPCTTAVFILAGEGVTLLYLRGEFTARDVSETVNALRYMVIGMPAFAFIEIVNRVFYSKKAAYIPMIAALSGIGANLTASALLVGVEEMRVGSVGLGNAIGLTTAAAVLAVFLLLRTQVINRELIITLIKLTASSLLSGVIMTVVYRLIGNDYYTAGVLGNIICSSLIVICGGAVYFLTIKLTGAVVTVKKRSAGT